MFSIQYEVFSRPYIFQVLRFAYIHYIWTVMVSILQMCIYAYPKSGLLWLVSLWHTCTRIIIIFVSLIVFYFLFLEFFQDTYLWVYFCFIYVHLLHKIRLRGGCQFKDVVLLVVTGSKCISYTKCVSQNCYKYPG